MGISTSRLCDRRAYRGRVGGAYRMRAHSGRWPWRTTRRWPVSVLRSACLAKNSATSASTAWVRSARAPPRRISVRESVKAPGWASWITLLSDTAYHSFIGEVEALNTTTIRRLTRSRRHQLLAIAPSCSERVKPTLSGHSAQRSNAAPYRISVIGRDLAGRYDLAGIKMIPNYYEPYTTAPAHNTWCGLYNSCGCP